MDIHLNGNTVCVKYYRDDIHKITTFHFQSKQHRPTGMPVDLTQAADMRMTPESLAADHRRYQAQAAAALTAASMQQQPSTAPPHGSGGVPLHQLDLQRSRGRGIPDRPEHLTPHPPPPPPDTRYSVSLCLCVASLAWDRLSVCLWPALIYCMCVYVCQCVLGCYVSLTANIMCTVGDKTSSGVHYFLLSHVDFETHRFFF